MSAAYVEQQFEQHRSMLTPSPELLHLRQEALARFDTLGFPTRKHEQWRYTDLGPIRTGPFDFAPPVPDQETLDRARRLAEETALEESSVRCVFVDGHFVSKLSRTPTTPGVGVFEIAERWADALANTALPDNDHALTALNTAFSQHGVFIRVEPATEVDRPLELIFIGSGRRSAPQPRVVVELGERASASFVQHFVDLDAEGTSWLNIVTEIRQGARSRLRLHRVQNHAATTLHTSRISAVLDREAELEYAGVDLGSQLARNDIEITLREPYSRASLAGLTMVADTRHADNHVRIDHRGVHTTSRQTFRNIAADNGHAVYNGKVVVHADAQKIDARQASDNLLLSQSAEIDTKPELEIYADDVKCSHGATVGEIDEEQMFYLRARGIDEPAARRLLTFAFANVVLDEFAWPELQRRIARHIAGEMPEAVELIESLP